jgi:ABC-type phosphate/phosphonate transport system substrate-binding protein
LAAVASGVAEAASIDCVTFGLLADVRPRAVAGVRVLTVTAASPAPPFVVPRATTNADRSRWYDALAAAIGAPQLAEVRRALHLTGLVPAELTSFDAIARYEGEAIDLGYPVLA